MSKTRDDVSFTAKNMAAGRAYETRRSDALFIDPFAEKLAGKEVLEDVIPRLEADEKAGKPFTSIRTRYFDDLILGHSQNIQQIVLLGAGLDTRALRMEWAADTHVYEIDQSNILTYKESVLEDIQPTCNRHAIAADLKDSLWSEMLIKQGYQPSKPSIWLLEGVLYYLNEEEVHNLLTTITTLSVKGSWFGADVINSVIMNGQDSWAKYWLSCCDDPEAFFGQYGWQASAIQPGDEGASFGRFTFQFPDPSLPDQPHLYFIAACRQE